MPQYGAQCAIEVMISGFVGDVWRAGRSNTPAFLQKT
jgi:hypothetical protein